MNIASSLVKILKHPFNRKRPLHALGKLLFWKINQIFFRWPIIVQVNDDVKCICYPNSSFGGLVVYTTYPEFIEHRLFELLTTKDMTIIDIGANIGFVSLIAAKRTKEAVYAFEIDSRVLPILKENIQINNLHNQVQLIEAAASNTSGKAKFKHERTSETSHIQYTDSSSEDSANTVSCIALDDFVKKHRITDKLLIKIDVEGAEMLVFKGMEDLLSSKKPSAILFEINKNCLKFGYSMTEITDLIRSYKYSIINLDTRKELTNEDIFNMESTAINVLAIDNKTITFKKVLSLLTRI